MNLNEVLMDIARVPHRDPKLQEKGMGSDITKRMAEDIADCGAIASSALVLAADRTSDLNLPVVITFTMLRKLCEENIQICMGMPPSSPVLKLAEGLGVDVSGMKQQALKGLEELIDDYFKHCKVERQL